ncbi:MAG: hypothetical protein MZW92_06270 [Comamonadaceae bacterium]|nr:hypothetical protein [Comamonadaceae bacterium]
MVIHDCVEFDGSPVALSPRSVLRRVLALYEAAGLAAGGGAGDGVLPGRSRTSNPHDPLQPPLGPLRPARSRAARATRIDAVNEFDPLLRRTSTHFCEAAGHRASTR